MPATTTCPREAEHTPMPSGYVARQLWSEQMARTHRQTRCRGCQLLAVWVPLADAPVLPPIEYRLDHADCGCCDGDNATCDCLYHPGALRTVATRRWSARKAARAAARVVACTIVTPPDEPAFADITLELTDGGKVRQQVGLAQAQQLIDAAGEG